MTDNSVVATAVLVVAAVVVADTDVVTGLTDNAAAVAVADADVVTGLTDNAAAVVIAGADMMIVIATSTKTTDRFVRCELKQQQQLAGKWKLKQRVWRRVERTSGLCRIA